MPRERWFSRAGFVILSALLAGSMWAVPYLPTNDGPEWAFSSHVENHYGDPGSSYVDIFTPTLQFAARGFSPLYGPFEAWLGWERGLSCALSLMVLLVAWGFVTLVHAVDRDRWALGFLGFPLALSWELYMGLWAFVVATGISLFVLALAAHLRAPTWKGRSLLACLLFLDAVAHVFGAVLAGGCVLLLSLARAPRGTRLTELAKVALTGLPAMGILVACVVVSSGAPDTPMAHGFERLPWRDAVAILPQTLAPGPLARALALALAVGAAGALAFVRASRRDTSATDRGLGVAAVLLLALAVLTPFQIPGWQGFSQRFVPLAASLAMAVLPLERLSLPLRKAACPVLFAAAALSLLLTYPFHRRLAALCPDALAGLTAEVHLTGTLFPVVIRNTELATYDRVHAEVPLMSPLVHMGTLYATAHGGVAALTFASNPAIHAFVWRPGVPARPLPDTEHYLRALASPDYHHDLAYRQQVDAELARFGSFYDEVAVFGALPEDLAVWRELGFVTDWQQGSALLAHFERPRE